MKINSRETLRFITFLAGVMLIGLGVSLMNKSGLGLGPWNVTDANLELWIGVTLGQASILHTLVVITLVSILNKNPKYYLSLITTALVGLAIDLWNYTILGGLLPQSLFEQIIFEIIGFLGITMGLASILITRYPAMVFDELTLTIHRMFKHLTFPTIRIFIEFSGLGIAFIYSALGGFGLGALGWSPFVLAFCFGPAIHFFKQYFQRLVKW